MFSARIVAGVSMGAMAAIATSDARQLQNIRDTCSLFLKAKVPTAYAWSNAPTSNQNPLFPTVYTEVTTAKPPFPTLTSSLSLAEQAYYLEDICAYGLPSIDNVVIRRPYVSSVNFRTKCPNWVAEHYTNIPDENDTERSNVKLSRKGVDFRADTALPKPFRALPGDYTNTGYSRGHLATAASHNSRELDLAETFLLSNIVPQNNVMNEGDWAKLERFSRELTRYFTHVRTVTGPLFLPSVREGRHQVQYEVMGKNQVHVPTHLFKIVYLEGVKKPLPTDMNFTKQASRFRVPHTEPLPLPMLQKPGAQNTRPARVGGTTEVYVLAFAVPNHSESVDTPLQSYIMPLSVIEKASGLCLAPRSTPDSLTMDTTIRD